MTVKRLSGWDAMLLYSEVPDIPTHTLKVAVLDITEMGEGFTFDRFRRIVARKLTSLQPLRYRLVDVPFKLHHPMWLENSEVDLDYHVRRVQLPQPATRRDVDALITRIASETLQRDRPLWELTYVEGLAPHTVVLIAKVHHALADGVASANLLAFAMDSARAGSFTSVPDSTRWPSTAQLVSAAAHDHSAHVKQLPAVIRDTFRGVTRVRRQRAKGGENPYLARAFAPPATFLNHSVSRNRRFATASIALADAKQVSKQFEVTLNDVVLAMSAGALRQLLLRYDGAADHPLIASVPVNTDRSPDRISGNALGAMFVSLPVHVSDPQERVRLTKIGAGIAKEDSALLGPELVGRWVDYLPPPLGPPAFKWLAQREAKNSLYNLSISNVRGPAQRGEVDGAPISEFYSVGPLTPGSGMNITVWSYAGRMNFSVLTDDRTVRDADEVGAALLRDFVEIRSAAGLPERAATMTMLMSQTL